MDILGAVGRVIQSPRNLAQPPVVLTDASVRRFVRKLVELQYPEVAVLSYDELTPTIQVRSLDRIALDGAAA
jgi:type III secretion protein V